MEDAARHLALLTRTTEVVNSSLDLQEVMEAIAHEVAAALETAKKMHKRGIRVLIGGDYGFAWTPQGTNAKDLKHFVDLLGYSPSEAMVCATKFGGELMGLPGGKDLALQALVSHFPPEQVAEIVQAYRAAVAHQRIDRRAQSGHERQAGDAKHVGPRAPDTRLVDERLAHVETHPTRRGRRRRTSASRFATPSPRRGRREARLSSCPRRRPLSPPQQLRRKFEPDPSRPRHLVTEPGMGYRFEP